MLVVLLDVGLVFLDVSAVHPATNRFTQRAARQAGLRLGAALSIEAACGLAHFHPTVDRLRAGESLQLEQGLCCKRQFQEQRLRERIIHDAHICDPRAFS
jgi:hypothetical protein